MLNFIKNHYEKIILTFLLIVFVVLLAFQLSMLLAGRRISEGELSVKKRNPDHTRLNFKDHKYNAVIALSSVANWAPAGPRTLKATLYTDFVMPLSLGRCPFCKHYIPFTDFSARKCSYCLKTLPPKVQAPTFIDPTAGTRDTDTDGFTDAEELTADPPTNVNDPKSHPSYAKKLSVAEVTHKKLSIKILTIIAKSDDKAKWEVHVQVIDGGKERTRFLTFAKNTVKCDDGEYKLLNIMPDYKEELDNSVKRKLEKNYSTAIFQRTGSQDKLQAEIGKEIVEGKEKVVIYNELLSKSSDYYVGDTISIGDDRCGIEKFILVSCNSKDLVALIRPEDKPNAKEIEIFKKKAEIKPVISDPNMMMGPGGMMGPNGPMVMGPNGMMMPAGQFR